MGNFDRTKLCLVFVESNTTGTGRLFTRAAVECGYRPVLLAKDPGKYPYVQHDAVDSLQCNTSSLEELQEVIKKLMSGPGVAGIFSSSEYFIETSAVLARTYQLPGNDPAALKACRNKCQQRIRMQSAGLLTPKFRLVSSVDEAIEAVHDIRLPAVLKPPVGSGSVGVKLCSTREQVVEHAAQLLHRTTNERGMPVSPQVLVEEYLPGPEISVETLGSEAVGITKKHLSREPFFVETGHDFPADLAPSTAEFIIQTVLKALRCLGLMWGPIHTELRLTAAGPVIIEVNPRLAGGFIPEIVRLATGLDLIRETINFAVDKAVCMAPHRKEFASIRFLIPARSGIVSNIIGISDALKIKGVVDIKMYKKIGEQLQIENDFRDRIGHVISHSTSRHTALQAAEVALNTIAIETRKVAAIA